MVVFDLRPMHLYHKSHFENSINFPIDKCDDAFFTKWDPTKIQNEILRNPNKKAVFEMRKRTYLYIIASEHDITHFLDKLPRLFNSDAIATYCSKYIDIKYKLENLLSLRLSLLLYKALKQERIREVYLCVNGFDSFIQKYPYFCKFKTSFLYPRK